MSAISLRSKQPKSHRHPLIIIVICTTLLAKDPAVWAEISQMPVPASLLSGHGEPQTASLLLIDRSMDLATPACHSKHFAAQRFWHGEAQRSAHSVTEGMNNVC
eukprot:scaffold207641_cov31-Prasinocladus_malaysianus.AAC.1